jgi:hypothetical protein
MPQGPWIPPPGQTSVQHGQQLFVPEQNIFNPGEQEQEHSGASEEGQKDDEYRPESEEDGGGEGERPGAGNGRLDGYDLSAMSLRQLRALHNKLYPEYVRDSWKAPNEEVYTAENLPPVTFQLENPARMRRPQDALRFGFINGPDGRPVLGPNGRAIINFPHLPRHISAGTDGWLHEAWDRTETSVVDPDYVARMNEEEHELMKEIEKREKCEAKKKGNGDDDEDEEDEELAKKPTDTKKSGTKVKADDSGLKTDKQVRNFKNALNMRRARTFRKPAGILVWSRRTGEHKPSETECLAIRGLSEEQIRLNTTLPVTPQGLQRMRLVGGYGERRSLVPMPGQFWPRDMFLTNGQEHVPSERLQWCLDLAHKLERLLEEHNKTEWGELPRAVLPDWWRQYQKDKVPPEGKVKGKGKGKDNKRKADKSDANEPTEEPVKKPDTKKPKTGTKSQKGVSRSQGTPGGATDSPSGLRGYVPADDSPQGYPVLFPPLRGVSTGEQPAATVPSQASTASDSIGGSKKTPPLGEGWQEGCHPSGYMAYQGMPVSFFMPTNQQKLTRFIFRPKVRIIQISKSRSTEISR